MEKELKANKSIIIHFDSQCKSCQDEARKLLDHINELKDIDIYFISTEDDIKQINLFSEYFSLSTYQNVTIGQDYTKTIPTYFNTTSTPLLILVDENKKIEIVVEGLLEASELIKIIKEN